MNLIVFLTFLTKDSIFEIYPHCYIIQVHLNYCKVFYHTYILTHSPRDGQPRYLHLNTTNTP